MTEVVGLADAHEDARFGAKATGLGAAARNGLPIPPGVALSGAFVEEVASGHEAAIEELLAAVQHLATPLAVRSSAVDEDSADASFAGQHLTLLNVPSLEDVSAAVREIWWSANSDSAITYRKRVGLFTRPSVGVVVQSLLAPDTAGVMFTQNPINQADEQLIEASWGLGEVVVAGRVIPDTFRIDRGGAVLERTPGLKKIAIRSSPDGGTFEETIAAEQVESLCLDDAQLAQLHALAERIEQVYGPARDVEWAFANGQLYLLQCRAVTRAGSSTKPTIAGDANAVAVIEKVPLFANMSPRDVAGIAALFKERRFAAGETITKEGAGAAAFFVIESGEATVSIGGQPRAKLTQGDYFGEIALIDEGARSATVIASSDLVCHGLTYWEFRPLVQSNAAIAWNLLQTLAHRLRDAQQDLHR
ncbi:MAG TPA: PEP/pyruvate-binding domain-containing protein [Acidimicrobiia bacterium]|jgi:pyruvate,water dikinase|nr:PEP/pyruvate-binding domain-containing protein [Acidimicrobiia bacterium]